ncbi:MAG: hypothetical protein AAFQ80_03780 [Cyanobacteria bacterium J06621_8]
MPWVQRINLNSGDAIFFDGYSIHRGNYRHDQLRQTLAILYGSPVDWFTLVHHDFIKSEVFADLSSEQQSLFYTFGANSHASDITKLL